MKKTILLVIFLLVSSNVSAEWYIFNSDNRAVARTSYEPSSEDLNTRGEFKVESNSSILVNEAEYRGGRVNVRVKSQQEKNEEKAIKDEGAEMAEVYHIMFREAFKVANDEGIVSGDNLSKHVDDIVGEKNKIKKKKTDFNSAKTKLMALGLTSDEIESLR